MVYDIGFGCFVVKSLCRVFAVSHMYGKKTSWHAWGHGNKRFRKSACTAALKSIIQEIEKYTAQLRRRNARLLRKKDLIADFDIFLQSQKSFVRKDRIDQAVMADRVETLLLEIICNSRKVVLDLIIFTWLQISLKCLEILDRGLLECQRFLTSGNKKLFLIFLQLFLFLKRLEFCLLLGVFQWLFNQKIEMSVNKQQQERLDKQENIGNFRLYGKQKIA